jgi:hypothetical protein
LNRRPADYESAALPLCYTGDRNILAETQENIPGFIARLLPETAVWHHESS